MIGAIQSGQTDPLREHIMTLVGRHPRRLRQIIQALRELVRTRADVPFARALGDPAIARCLQAFHADPAADFSIAELARLAALSRTTFCERFRETVGLSPADYMTRWRLDLAARYLAQDARLSVDLEPQRTSSN